MKRTRIGLFANSGWNFLNFRRELIEYLSCCGYELHLIAPDFLEEISELGETHPIEMTPAGMNFVAESAVIYRLSRLLKKLDLDCLLTFTIKPNLYGSLAASGRTRVICNITGLGEMFHAGQGMRSTLVSNVYRYALSRCSLAFVQNAADVEFLKTQRLVQPEKIRTVPGSGVNTVRFSPQACDEAMKFRNRRATHFLFVGRFRRDKGFEEFVAAADRLLQMNTDVRFTMVGASEPGRRYSIPESMLSELRDSGRVRIVDFQSDIRPLIASADCVVLPSYREGLSRSLLEAASMGKPVIATDVPGCRDALIDNQTGFLCSPKCPESLAMTMDKCHRIGAEQREAMGERGRNFVMENFSVERVVDIYARQIERILGQQPFAKVNRVFGWADCRSEETLKSEG